jgi:hypothetical protein
MSERSGVRDPELVLRAQRAAGELGRAWSRWRHARGLAEELSESVASYVAHSIDHPWGRPRVVLGLDAAEARALAELLGRGDPEGGRGSGGDAVPGPGTDAVPGPGAAG